MLNCRTPSSELAIQRAYVVEPKDVHHNSSHNSGTGTRIIPLTEEWFYMKRGTQLITRLTIIAKSRPCHADPHRAKGIKKQTKYIIVKAKQNINTLKQMSFKLH